LSLLAVGALAPADPATSTAIGLAAALSLAGTI
jgi:hypothetical protein